MTRLFQPLLFILIFIPIIQLPSPGFDQLLIPFNILLWCTAAVIIMAAGWLIHQKQQLILPQKSIFLYALPAGLIISGFIAGIVYPVEWLFRLGAILIGVLFLFALFQFKADRRKRDNALYALLAVLTWNGLISFIQMMPSRPLLGIVMHPERPSPLGFFMQPNLQASMMLTGVLVAAYLVSSPGFQGRNLAIKLLTYSSIAICTAIVMATGSRIGLIALITAVPLLLFARLPLLKRNRSYTALLITALTIGCSSGIAMSDGLYRAYSKLERLADEGKDARIHMYQIGVQAFAEKPLAGHGIGRFQSVFHQQGAEYLAAKGNEPLMGHSRFTHPHNELLLWAIEGGILAVSGILIAVAGVLLQLYKQGRQRGLAMLAILLPITLHTQVELPFYSSTMHWLVFLLLLFIALQPFQQIKPLHLSRLALSLIPVTTTLLAGIVIWLMVNTHQAAQHFTQFYLYNSKDIKHLQATQSSMYFQELGEIHIFKALLYTDISNNSHKWVEGYIQWATAYLEKTPEVSTMVDLAMAYYYLNNNEEALKQLQNGLKQFPQNPALLAAVELINKNKPIISDIIK